MYGAYTFYIPIHAMRIQLLLTLANTYHLDRSHPGGGGWQLTGVPICVSLTLMMGTVLPVLAGHLFIFFGEICIQILAHF